ncbi:MAG: DUF3047 domain-containing protein [Desulfobacterales bacterium]|uniref:DUF3047 domain-containing protein n=1 Tax=Candidatus Desulfatibia profunda TaxID=2841695 RepID=A0A8J6NQQ6_9BACT|nr:DUF3047 domain-containing protein [Candidatus Desulfatibia profunda]MBL7180717.1 DUF3047 domain-containing protein [Desulfobacterales bacterium]
MILLSTGIACLLLLAGFSLLRAQATDIIEVGKFSTANAGMDLFSVWKPLTFKKIKQHTSYNLVEDNGVTVVKATSNASASGLIRKIEIDPKLYPVLTWRWKVTKIYEKGDVTKKEGDDYPARIYITFKYEPGNLGFFEKLKYETAKTLYGEYPPIAALNYIWASKAPEGTIVPNPYTDRTMMIVVQSGTQKLNNWVEEARNVYEDYKKAFGEEPPHISGVAIMTDSDNTKESSVAFYGDIIFRMK